MGTNCNVLNDFQRGRLESLYEAMYKPLLMYASKHLTDRFSFLAEDCAQEAIYKAYSKRKDFVSETALKSYLYTTVRNQAIDILRNHNSKERYLQHVDVLEDSILNTVIEQDVLNRLFEAVQTLPERERALFFEYSNGMKTDEIAEKMGLSVSTIKQTKAKMIAHLSERISSDLLVLVFYVMLSDILK